MKVFYTYILYRIYIPYIRNFLRPYRIRISNILEILSFFLLMYNDDTHFEFVEGTVAFMARCNRFGPKKKKTSRERGRFIVHIHININMYKIHMKLTHR